MTFTASGPYLALALVLVVQGVTEGIRVTKVQVPESLVVGDSAWLDCGFEEEDDHVYTLKWYLGLHEFYRWTPAEIHEDKIFPLPSAFEIDLENSRRGRVRVLNVTLAATGNFRCEISGEAPFFRTSFGTATMTVVDPPDSKPAITGIKKQYRLRDFVDVNCTSINAKPAPEITFYIDNELAEPAWVMTYPAVNDTNGLMNVTKGLKFELHPNIKTNGKMQLKCTSASHLYWQSTDKVINIDLPYYYPVTSDVLQEDYPPSENGAPPTESKLRWTFTSICFVCLSAYIR
ncbi:uncharacterized protein LOC135221048 [Macrobrachium nipponense]|uniref:uncharacterized protein LOC135221048 n=1 Tax=Macrobrachium nipponense TaxID=159736 RepID=UPI0030C7A617